MAKILVYDRGTGQKVRIPEEMYLDAHPDGTPRWSKEPPPTARPRAPGAPGAPSNTADPRVHYGAKSVHAKTGPGAPVPAFAEVEQGPMMIDKNGFLEPAPTRSMEGPLTEKGWRRAIPSWLGPVNGALNTMTLHAGSRISPEWGDYSRQSAHDNPSGTTIGGLLGGMALGRVLPGGPSTQLAEGGGAASVYVPAAKLAAQQAAVSGISASNEAPEGQRLRAGVNAALASVPIALGSSVLLGPLTTRGPSGSRATVENTHPTGLTSPSTWTDPESMRLRASLARVSSLRGTPSDAADIAGEYAAGSANPVQGIVNFGKRLNETRDPATGLALFGADDAGTVVGKASRAADKHGAVISSFERQAEDAGNLPNLRRVFDEIRGQGTAELSRNPVNAGGPGRSVPVVAPGGPRAPQATGYGTQGPPVTERITTPSPPPGRVEPGVFYTERPGVPESNWTSGGGAPERIVSREVPASGRVGDFLSALDSIESRALPPQKWGPPLTRGSMGDAKGVVRNLRDEANKRGGYYAEQTSPDRAAVGAQLGKSSAAVNGEVEGQVSRTVGPEGLGVYRGAKGEYGLLQRVSDLSNPTKTATQAPNSLSSILEGAAAEQSAAAMGGGTATALAARAVGRMLGRQSNVNPKRASFFARLAEGTETPLLTPNSPVNGMPVSPGYRAAGAAVRGVRDAPGTVGAALAEMGGADVGDIYRDPRQHPLSARAEIVRALLDSEFFKGKGR